MINENFSDEEQSKNDYTNESLIKDTKMTNHEQTLFNTIQKFYSENDNIILHMLPIINGVSIISLRLLDWFVTNYSKKNNSSYNISEKNITKLFNVHYSYKSQLKAYSKKFFDPFCRGNRVPFFYDSENCIITTIGQLNFFKWAITNNVIDFVTENIKLIEYDMNKSNKNTNKLVKKIVKNIEVNDIKEDKNISTNNIKNNLFNNVILNKNVNITVTFE